MSTVDYNVPTQLCKRLDIQQFSSSRQVREHKFCSKLPRLVTYLVINPRRMREGYGTWFVINPRRMREGYGTQFVINPRRICARVTVLGFSLTLGAYARGLRYLLCH